MFYNLFITKWGGTHMTNNEKFNEMLNGCAHPRLVYRALCSLSSEPCVQKADDVSEKRQVLIAEVLSFLDKTERNQEPV